MNDEDNMLMNNTLIRTYYIEKHIACPPLISRTQCNSDEDGHVETVAEMHIEDEEVPRTMNKIILPRRDNDITPLYDMENDEHATDEEADETEPKEFDETVEDVIPLNEEECVEECLKS